MVDANKKTKLIEVGRTGIFLVALCAIIALLLSLLNIVTRDRISENEERNLRDAVVALFGSENIEYVLLEVTPEAVDAIYKVTEGETARGYCVRVSPEGFGGKIDILVGVDNSSSVIGVRIISHNETPRLGSRIENNHFLSQFIAITSKSEKNIDVISGSTVSSRAVTEGVRTALSALDEYLLGGVVIE
ncbi:MAG: FMN-binding protein [Clostridia bacterium]|nr:FMN-binding protein [Clostridia bacterium]